MKKIIFVSILVFSTLTSVLAQNCFYEDYYYWSGIASIEYSEEQYFEASKHYKIAFENNIFCLGSDLDLALNTAIQTKDTIWAEQLSIQLAKGGIPIRYFEKFKEYSWFNVFKSNFKSYQKLYETDFNDILKKQLLKLRHKDSLFNQSYHKWRRGEIDLSLDQLISGANETVEGFKKLIKEHGFPCEQNMGFYFVDENIEVFPVIILMIHIYQRGVLLLEDRLSNIVCDGKLKPLNQMSLNGFRGFGDSTGVEQEMKIRYEKYKK